MAKILAKNLIAPKTHYLRIHIPLISTHAQPGQFVIIRVTKRGERIPITIADTNPKEGSITIVVQEIGKTTEGIGKLNTGDDIPDILGPLGHPSEVENFGHVVLLGGGFGIAAIHLLAKALHEKGNMLTSIIGARTRELLIMKEPMRQVSDYLIVMTDDGSEGRKGLVTEPLQEILRDKGGVNRVIAVGPLPMMRAVAECTRSSGVKTIVSLNPIMVDGTGMCGGCRVQVGTETKFACTDGPEFDAHLVNFDEFSNRARMYRDFEHKSLEQCHMNQVSEFHPEGCPTGVQHG